MKRDVLTIDFSHEMPWQLCLGGSLPGGIGWIIQRVSGNDERNEDEGKKAFHGRAFIREQGFSRGAGLLEKVIPCRAPAPERV